MNLETAANILPFINTAILLTTIVVFFLESQFLRARFDALEYDIDRLFEITKPARNV